MITPRFIIASDILKRLFEAKDSQSRELLVKLKGTDAVTPQSSFLRAIYLTDSNTKIENIQKVIEFLKITPSKANFKDEDAVIEDVLNLAKQFSK